MDTVCIITNFILAVFLVTGIKGVLLPHKENCSDFYEVTANSSKVLRSCRFPELFSVITNTCQSFLEVDCQNRTKPTSPCDYAISNCTRHAAELCICADPSDLNFDMCRSLSDGNHVWTDHRWSPFYIQCLQNRTIPQQCLKETEVFNFINNRCELLGNVVNEAYSLHSNISIPSSLHRFIIQPTVTAGFVSEAPFHPQSLPQNNFYSELRKTAASSKTVSSNGPLQTDSDVAMSKDKLTLQLTTFQPFVTSFDVSDTFTPTLGTAYSIFITKNIIFPTRSPSSDFKSANFITVAQSSLELPTSTSTKYVTAATTDSNISNKAIAIMPSSVSVELIITKLIYQTMVSSYNNIEIVKTPFKQDTTTQSSVSANSFVLITPSLLSVIKNSITSSKIITEQASDDLNTVYNSTFSSTTTSMAPGQPFTYSKSLNELIINASTTYSTVTVQSLANSSTLYVPTFSSSRIGHQSSAFSLSVSESINQVPGSSDNNSIKTRPTSNTYTKPTSLNKQVTTMTFTNGIQANASLEPSRSLSFSEGLNFSSNIDLIEMASMPLTLSLHNDISEVPNHYTIHTNEVVSSKSPTFGFNVDMSVLQSTSFFNSSKMSATKASKQTPTRSPVFRTQSIFRAFSATANFISSKMPSDVSSSVMAELFPKLIGNYTSNVINTSVIKTIYNTHTSSYNSNKDAIVFPSSSSTFVKSANIFSTSLLAQMTDSLTTSLGFQDNSNESYPTHLLIQASKTESTHHQMKSTVNSSHSTVSLFASEASKPLTNTLISIRNTRTVNALPSTIGNILTATNSDSKSASDNALDQIRIYSSPSSSITSDISPSITASFLSNSHIEYSTKQVYQVESSKHGLQGQDQLHTSETDFLQVVPSNTRSWFSKTPELHFPFSISIYVSKVESKTIFTDDNLKTTSLSTLGTHIMTDPKLTLSSPYQRATMISLKQANTISSLSAFYSTQAMHNTSHIVQISSVSRNRSSTATDQNHAFPHSSLFPPEITASSKINLASTLEPTNVFVSTPNVFTAILHVLPTSQPTVTKSAKIHSNSTLLAMESILDSSKTSSLQNSFHLISSYETTESKPSNSMSHDWNNQELLLMTHSQPHSTSTLFFPSSSSESITVRTDTSEYSTKNSLQTSAITDVSEYNLITSEATLATTKKSFISYNITSYKQQSSTSMILNANPNLTKFLSDPGVVHLFNSKSLSLTLPLPTETISTTIKTTPLIPSSTSRTSVFAMLSSRSELTGSVTATLPNRPLTINASFVTSISPSDSRNSTSVNTGKAQDNKSDNAVIISIGIAVGVLTIILLAIGVVTFIKRRSQISL